ncbi:MAG: Gfo/Idh/MocA family oxidoreductase [Candidatus Omnitrophica bacterium]|nr:Gfo/Idh/MocA family oxidoreductase [Candidatus Omnitrophota bacterium]
MRVCLFGLGSIGRRHAKLLSQFDAIDLVAFRTGKGQQKNGSGVPEIFSWDEVKEFHPDIAVISNPTFLHIDTALLCAEMGMHLFIEKPIDVSVRRLKELTRIVSDKDLLTYVAYVLRFHPAIKYIKDQLQSHQVLNVSVRSSSYLPDWRPGFNYKEMFSVRKDQGGGVILDLSHEFDYIQYLFGSIETMEGKFGQASNITIDAEDYCDAIIRTENCPSINLHLDYFSRYAERYLKIDVAGGAFMVDLIKSTVEWHHDGRVDRKDFPFERDDIYREQLELFMDHVKQGRPMSNNLEEASVLFEKIIAFKERGSL